MHSPWENMRRYQRTVEITLRPIHTLLPLFKCESRGVEVDGDGNVLCMNH